MSSIERTFETSLLEDPPLFYSKRRGWGSAPLSTFYGEIASPTISEIAKVCSDTTLVILSYLDHPENARVALISKQWNAEVLRLVSTEVSQFLGTISFFIQRLPSTFPLATAPLKALETEALSLLKMGGIHIIKENAPTLNLKLIELLSPLKSTESDVFLVDYMHTPPMAPLRTILFQAQSLRSINTFIELAQANDLYQEDGSLPSEVICQVRSMLECLLDVCNYSKAHELISVVTKNEEDEQGALLSLLFIATESIHKNSLPFALKAMSRLTLTPNSLAPDMWLAYYAIGLYCNTFTPTADILGAPFHLPLFTPARIPEALSLMHYFDNAPQTLSRAQNSYLNHMIYQSYLSIIIAQTKTDIALAVKIFESINHLPIIQEELVLHGLRDSHPYTALWSQFISALPECFLQLNEEMGS